MALRLWPPRSRSSVSPFTFGHDCVHARRELVRCAKAAEGLHQHGAARAQAVLLVEAALDAQQVGAHQSAQCEVVSLEDVEQRVVVANPVAGDARGRALLAAEPRLAARQGALVHVHQHGEGLPQLHLAPARVLVVAEHERLDDADGLVDDFLGRVHGAAAALQLAHEGEEVAVAAAEDGHCLLRLSASLHGHALSDVRADAVEDELER